jgi:hypothetical protein
LKRQNYNPTVVGPVAFTYLSHYFPIGIFKKPNIHSIVNNDFLDKVRTLSIRLNNFDYPTSQGAHTIYILNNFTNVELDFLHNQLVPLYKEELSKIGFKNQVGYGTYDTFVDKNPERIQKLFLDFISICFLLTAVSWVFLKIASFNRYLLPLLILFGVAVSAHIYYDDEYGLIKWSINNLMKFLLFYTVPVYLITIFITGIISFIIHRIINRGGAI